MNRPSVSGKGWKKPWHGISMGTSSAVIPPKARACLCCPTCHGDLQWFDEVAVCVPCAKRFPISGTLIDFLEAPELDPLTARLESTTTRTP